MKYDRDLSLRYYLWSTLMELLSGTIVPDFLVEILIDNSSTLINLYSLK